MLLDRKWGGGGGKSSKKAEQAWPLQQLCTPRPLPRRHDPEPRGVLSPAAILQTPAATQPVHLARLATLGGSKSKPTRPRRRF
jgi:hypothetical protein